MTLQEQFDRILQKELTGEISPFLKALDKAQRKALQPHVKKQGREYLDYKEVRSGNSVSFRRKASPKQQEMLREAVFVCGTRADAERLFFGGSFLERHKIDPLLEWHCPEWFNAYVNDLATSNFTPVDYDWMISLTERGFLDPRPELIVRLLPQIMVYYNDPSNKERCIIDAGELLKYEITLKEHIWYIFQFESTISGTDAWLRDNTSEKTGWKEILVQFTREGKMERTRVLKEALLATTRNFNKTLSGWFADLFTEMEPAVPELLDLQPELLVVLSSPHSKPLNTALQCFKKLSGEEGFDRTAFLDHTPILFSSTTKSVITAALSVLEKLARQYKEHRDDICVAACQVFMLNDDELQSRAAKLIQKYGNPAADALKDALAQYQETMMVGARNVLQELIAPVSELQSPAVPVQPASTRSLLDERSLIPPILNFDELIFLASQVLDNNQPYHADQLLAALIALQHEVKGANIRKLEPAFQRAYALLSAGFSNTGEFNTLQAVFLTEYSLRLADQFPLEAATLREMHEKHAKQDKENKEKWGKNYQFRIRPLAEWVKAYRTGIFGWYLRMLQVVLKKVTTGDTLPLLSTPTHAPAWISPFALIDRLYQYQLNSALPDELDMQIAVSRIALEQTEAALAYASEKLEKEYLQLVRFLLEPEASPPGHIVHPSWWMVAAMSKSPKKLYPVFEVFPHVSPTFLTGQCTWSTEVEHRTRNVYDFLKKKTVVEPYTEKVLKLVPDKAVTEKTPVQPVRSFLSSLFSFGKEKKQPASQLKPEFLIYEQLTLNNGYIANNDIRQMLLFIPNNPEPLLALIANRYLRLSSDSGGELVRHTLQVLHDLPGAWGEMGHLFTAVCMGSSDKTMSAFAAEIWINRVNYGTIKSRLIGEILGKMQHIGFVPLKRLNDLVLSHMFRLSDLHNAELEELLLGLLGSLPEEPVKHLKKLLEIFAEVLSANRSGMQDPRVISLLKTWSATAALNKVINNLIKE